MSDLFDFNASLNDVAPVSLMPFPVDLMRTENGLFEGCNLGVVFSLS